MEDIMRFPGLGDSLRISEPAMMENLLKYRTRVTSDSVKMEEDISKPPGNTELQKKRIEKETHKREKEISDLEYFMVYVDDDDSDEDELIVPESSSDQRH